MSSDKTNLSNHSQPRFKSAKSVSTIKQIDNDSIRYISAGEKINDIETVIRELIENSLDAGATIIEVRLTRFGVDVIEVEDNGDGIDEEDFPFLGQRYHTSKITDFEKLQRDLVTFGFRGEAISCLCSISNVTIVTRSRRSPTGSKLIFNKDGSLLKKEAVARSIGTTVTIKNLFHSLPVRRRDLEMTSKRQYDKVVRVIYEHVLVRPEIKFALCKNYKTKKDKDFAHGGTSLERCIVSIFGIKTLDSLMPIKQPSYSVNLEDDTEKCNDLIDINDVEPSQKFECSIAPDRDKFYRRQSKSKFRREKPNYTIFGYISKPGCGRNASDSQFIFVNNKPCELSKVTRLINDSYRNYSHNQHPFLCLFIQVQNWAADFNVPRKRAVILAEENRLCDIIKETLDTMFAPSLPATTKTCPSALLSSITANTSEGCSPRGTKREGEGLSDEHTRKHVKKDQVVSEHEKLDQEKLEPNKAHLNPKHKIKNKHNDHNYTICVSQGTTDATQPENTISETSSDSGEDSSDQVQSTLAIDYFNCRLSQENKSENGRLSAKIDHHEDMPSALERERAQRRLVIDSKEYMFAIHPDFNKVSEQELKLNLCRQSFENMDIVGQFNKGFIITRYNDHLFIIDQHATDERANFEDQLDKCPLDRQPMVRPKPLLFNSIQENTIMSHLEEFEKRGFQFVVDESKMAGYRVQLASTSICKGHGTDVYLDKNDVEELVGVAMDSPHALSSYTLRKVNDLAASKACRKSVMIGDAISETQMRSIVSKMSGLSNPWICAHGRPTIRHLMDVKWVRRMKEKSK